MYKKINVFLFYFLIFSLCIIATTNTYPQSKINHKLSFVTEYSGYNKGTFKSYGLGWQWFIDKNVSINYQYSFGTTPDGNFYMHLPGIAGGFLSLLGPDFAVINDEYLFFLVFIIPEGISYKFHAREWFEPELFINPLGSEFNHYGNTKASISGTAGIKADINIGKWFFVSPYNAMRMVYRTRDIGIIYGLNVGIRFK